MKLYICALALTAILLSCNNPKIDPQDLQLEEINNQVKPLPPGPPYEKEEQLLTADTSVIQTGKLLNNSSGKIKAENKQVDIDWDKKIIKTASITLELKDYKAFDNTIHNGLKQFGAYIAQENQAASDYEIMKEITIKVPVDQFDNLMHTFEGDKIKLIGKNISTEDVTGEVIDVIARVEAKKAVRTKYIELLKQAKNMEDILQVQHELISIQEDIESATGRVEYLQHAAAYSTVNLKYFQYINGKTGDDLKPNFFTQLSNAFSQSLTIISNLLLFIITVWPVLFIMLIIILLLKRRSRVVMRKNV